MWENLDGEIFSKEKNRKDVRAAGGREIAVGSESAREKERERARERESKRARERKTGSTVEDGGRVECRMRRSALLAGAGGRGHELAGVGEWGGRLP